MTGVLLVLQHPEIAAIDCGHCQEYFYDFDPKSKQFGKPRRKHNGTDDLRKRDWSCPAPCRTPLGCPNGTPEQPKRLTATNEQAYRHYLECRAVGQFPDDPIVRRNAAIIRDAEDAVNQMEEREFRRVLVQLSASRGL